jgi:hypothetical protein
MPTLEQAIRPLQTPSVGATPFNVPGAVGTPGVVILITSAGGTPKTLAFAINSEVTSYQANYHVETPPATGWPNVG